MNTFGDNLKTARTQKGVSQGQLADMMGIHSTHISRYERDEMTPSIEVAKKIANLLQTTVGYLLGENDDDQLFKDPNMLQRLKELSQLPEEDRKHIIYALDGLLQNVKAKKAFA
jgi:transcriptional regulator with XRE-family HTH domain